MKEIDERIRLSELIQRRRRQILVHAFIYYELNTNLISDNLWTSWANELFILQQEYPEISEDVELYDEFKDFDPSTGFNLNYRQDWVVRKAHQLLKSSRRR